MDMTKKLMLLLDWWNFSNHFSFVVQFTFAHMGTVAYVDLAGGTVRRKCSSYCFIVRSTLSASLLRMSAFGIWHNSNIKMLSIKKLLPSLFCLFLVRCSVLRNSPYSSPRSLNFSNPFHKGFSLGPSSGRMLFNNSRAAGLQCGPSMFSYSQVLCIGRLRFTNS